MNDPADTLDRLVAHAGQLYSLPAVAVQVLELTNNPQVDTRALKDCIENDPALTAKLLRVVNSSLFGLSREVSDLNQALALLGSKPLKLLVLGFSLPSDLYVGVTGNVLGWYWRHTLTKAVAGREISETLFHMPGDDAFIAGLLQDLGILLLIKELGEPYVDLLEKSLTDGYELAPLEVESIGFDHRTLSARLLSHWRLPAPLVEAVGWASAQGPAGSAAAQAPLARVLHLAELLARLLADDQAAALKELLDESRAGPRFSQSQLAGLVSTLDDKVRQLADVFSLQLPNGLNFADILIRAHAQLAAVASESAAELLGRAQDRRQSPETHLLKEICCLSEATTKLVRPAVAGTAFADSRRPAPSRGRCEQGNAEEDASHSRRSPAGPAAAHSVRSCTGPGRTETLDAEPGLVGRLTAAVAKCRQSRCGLSLLLLRLDEVDELVLTCGVEGFRRLRRLLQTLCEEVDHPSAVCLPLGEAGFALILPNCERRAAVQWGNQLIAAVHRAAPSNRDNRQQAINLCVGVATVALPPKNFPADDLLTAAQRCLYGSEASGGGVVKSIEIY